MKTLLTYARAGLLVLANLLMAAVFWASPAPAQVAPTPVAVSVEFGDNVCVGNEYTQPTMNAAEFPGTAQTITGTVAPGETVEVTYTALQGFVIEGQSTFTHTFPSEPASVTDCECSNQPEPLVRDRSAERTNCGGIERRECQVVTDYVWDGSEWVLGEPEIQNDTGWVSVRNLTPTEQKQLGCLVVAGEEDPAPNDNENDGEEELAPTTEVAPTQQTVPTAVDAGLSESVVAPAGPRWLAPLLSGVIMLGLGACTRRKGTADLTRPPWTRLTHHDEGRPTRAVPRRVTAG